MNSGYLGAIIMCSALLLFALCYYVFRTTKSDSKVYGEAAATLSALVLTGLTALGLTITAGNAYLTDATSTIVSLLMIAAAVVAVGVTIMKTRVSSDQGIIRSDAII